MESEHAPGPCGVTSRREWLQDLRYQNRPRQFVKRRSRVSVQHKLVGPALTLALSVSGAGLCGVAQAGTNEEQAKKLAEQALFDDYLNLKFEAAKTKLILAVDLCRDQCDPEVRAKLYRDLGVVYVAGLKNRDEGVGAFMKAVQIDPAVQLDPDLSNEDIASAFKEAQQLTAAGADAPPPPPGEPAAPAPDQAVTHTRVTHAAVNTPLPLWIRVDAGALESAVKKATVFFRGFGMARFKAESMGAMDDGVWGVELGCGVVGSSEGLFEYYIVVVDGDGDQITSIGTESKPIHVNLQRDVPSAPAPIPGSKAPEACETGPAPAAVASVGGVGGSWDADCPPDFPGCGAKDDSGEGDGAVEPDYERHWFSVGFQQDFLFMDASDNACASDAPASLTCFYQDGRVRDAGEFEFIGSSSTSLPPFNTPGAPPGTNGASSAGLALGTQRVLFGYEFALTPAFHVGGKVGFAFNGGPQSKYYYYHPTPVDAAGNPTTRRVDANAPADEGPIFVPLHAEVRLSYYLLTEGLFQPFIGLSTGLSQVDAKVNTQVRDQRYTTQGCSNVPTGTAGDCWTDVEVWQKSGTAFAGGSLGTLLAFGKNHGLTLEGRFLFMFPASSVGLGAQAGYTIGL